jgi:hypothetical protein
MTSKIASILTKVSNALSIAALAVVVIAPMMWMEQPYLSVWPLAHALCIVWDVTPKTHKSWDLWLSAAFRVAITAWEIIDVRFFSEGIHPSVSVGLYILLGGAVLYLVAVALWSIGRKTHAEQEETE